MLFYFLFLYNRNHDLVKKIFTLLLLLTTHLICYAQGGIWTWVKGDSYQSASWIDRNGNFWIFGGAYAYPSGEMQDLWEYNPHANIWTWMNGPDSAYGIGTYGPGIYGTMGMSSPNNIPGARGWGVTTWTDQQGRLWMHGGQGFDGFGNYGLLDDMWMYDISSNEWTWMKGIDTADSGPVYDTLGVPSFSASPGSRFECNTAWVKSDGTLWTFGGFGIDSGKYGCYNDMWKYDISQNEWTWIAGPQVFGHPADYGVQGVETASNLPAGRMTYTHWQEPNDEF